MSARVTIESLPFTLTWQPMPVEFRSGSNSLVAEAGGETDLFVDPGTQATRWNAPRLVGQVTGDFTLAARVNVDFRTTFDAGALLIWANDHSWAKLCFELSPQGNPTVVSVVTRVVSDDCNSFTTDRGEIWLRLARLGPAVAFHASTDGRRWDLIRHFGPEIDAEALVGFVVQSPRGAGCVARFEEISFTPSRLADIRSGD